MPGHGGDVGQRVEALLAQLHRQGGDAAAATGDELVRALVEFYGSGLEHIAGILDAQSPDMLTAIADDPLVESQLMLHGLHPLSVDQRIERALDRVRPYLGSHAGGIAYLGVDDEGIAHLRLDGSCNGCASSTVTVRLTIEEAVLAAAPEIMGLDVEGQADKPKPLIQIGMRPGAAPIDNGPVWKHPSSHELPGDGAVAIVRLDGRPVLICRLGDTFYAYADHCPSCAGSLAGAALHDEQIVCPSCASRFDARLAGRALDGSGRHLDPLPLLDDVSGVRVALQPEAV